MTEVQPAVSLDWGTLETSSMAYGWAGYNATITLQNRLGEDQVPRDTAIGVGYFMTTGCYADAMLDTPGVSCSNEQLIDEYVGTMLSGPSGTPGELPAFLSRCREAT